MSSDGNPMKRKATDDDNDCVVRKAKGSWTGGLKSSMEDSDLRVDSDDKVVIIKDKYPKAKYHFLILPKENIANLRSLSNQHISLLKHMHSKGEEIVKRANSHLPFRLGYHAVPSMSQIHLHVISQDFDSPCLKTKKHWNSFTSEYFIDSLDIISMLEKTGKVTNDETKYKDILKRDLRCHKCSKLFSTMPLLKKHLPQHVPQNG